MKKYFIKIIKFLLFITAFLYAVYIFLPWDAVGRFAMSTAHNTLARRGIKITYTDITGEDDGFTVHTLGLSGPVNINAGSITIRPVFLGFSVAFSGLLVRLGQVLDFGDGGFFLTAGGGVLGEILLEDLHTNGDFSLDGYLSFNLAAMKIGRSQARLKVPESFAQNMSMLQNFLPLIQEGGHWYLRRD